MSELIPQGRYAAVAVAMSGEDGTHLVRWGRAGEKKTQQVLIYFEILEGPHAGVRLPWFGFFTRPSYERTLQALRYMGWVGDDLANPGALDQKVQVTVEHHEWKGKIHARIAWVNRSGHGSIKLHDQFSDDDLRQFAAQMKTRFSLVAVVKGERVVREIEPSNDDWSDAEHEVDDEVPF